jgi:very-short-patch-repair endonuclease
MEKKMFYGAPPNSFQKARLLRNGTTRQEEILWESLRKNKILGVRFRRQHPIGTYVADFYCHSAKLVIELDGPDHNSPAGKEYDAERTFNLNVNGLKVIRFSNHQIDQNLTEVVVEIAKAVQESFTKIEKL